MVTAEIRWFFEGVITSSTFMQSFAFSESSARVDYYLVHQDTRLGVKWRERNLEAKQQLGISEPYSQADVAGEIEFWKKWSFALNQKESYQDELETQSQHWIAVHKQRRIASFAYDVIKHRSQPSSPSRQVHDGCNLEITYITVREGSYTTLGLEAFGSRENLRQNLISTIGYLIEKGNLENLDLSLATSNNYARWFHTQFSHTTS